LVQDKWIDNYLLWEITSRSSTLLPNPSHSSMSLALERVGSGLKDSIGSILNQLEWASFGHSLG
jgi:hypothetical protein